MFDNSLFIIFDHGDDIPADLHKILREGTQIQEMNGSEIVKFRDLVTSRIKELTHQLTQDPYFILAFRRDGVIRVTERFERMWKHKEAYWEDDVQSDRPEPAKRRKKSKVVRAKTPIMLPSRQERDNSMSELLAAQIDMGSRMQLASMAENALELYVGQEELSKRQEEQSFFAEFMVGWMSLIVKILPADRFFLQNVDTEPDFSASAPTPSSTRSVSPGESIVVESRRTEVLESPSSTPSIAPFRESQTSDKQVSRRPTLESTSCLNSPNKQTCILKIPTPSPPMLACSPQETVTEAEQAVGTASNGNTATKQPQQSIADLSTLMRDFSEAGWSRVSHGVSPTNLAASRSLGRIDSTSTSTLSPQNFNQPPSISSYDTTSAYPPKGHTEFNWLDPDKPTIAGTAHSSNAPSGDDDGVQACSIPGYNKCCSPHVAQETRDSELEYHNHQTSTSSTPESSRSSPFERVDDLGNPSAPNTNSTQSYFDLTKKPPPQINKLVNESLNERLPAEPQPQPSNPSSNSMKLSNILGDGTNYYPKDVLNYPQVTGKPGEAPSVSTPQMAHPRHVQISSLSLADADSSPRAQVSPVHGNARWIAQARIPDQRRNPTSTEPLASAPNPSPAQHRSSEPPQTPTNEGMVKRKAGPWPFRPMFEIMRPGPSDLVDPESNNDNSPLVQGLQDTRNNWDAKDAAKPKAELFVSGNQNKASAPASQSPIFKTSQAPVDTTLEPQLSESPEKFHPSTIATDRATPQIDNECAQASAVSFLPKSKTCSPAEQTFQSHGFHERQTAPCLLETTHSFRTLSSAATGLPSSVTVGTSPTHKESAAVDVLIQRHGSSTMQNDGSSNTTPYHSHSTVDQPPQPHSSMQQKTIHEATKIHTAQSSVRLDSQAWQSVFPTATSQVQIPPFAIPSPIQTNRHYRTCESQPESPVLEEIFAQGQALTCQSRFNHPNQLEQLVPQETSPQKPLSTSQVEENIFSSRINSVPQEKSYQGLANGSQTYDNTPSLTTRPVQCPSPTGDLTPKGEKRLALTVQEPISPPTQDNYQRRNGSYSFILPSKPFSPYKSATTPPPDTRVRPAPILSTDTRLATTSASSGVSTTPTLTLLIESADGNMSLETTHSFEIVKNSSLSEFFQFYSSVSGTPLSTLTSLELQPTFGKRSSHEIRRYGGENTWKRLGEVIQSQFDKAVRKDKEGRTEWLVLVSSE